MLDGVSQVSAGWRERVGHVCEEKDEGGAECNADAEEVKGGPADKKATSEVSVCYLGVSIM